MEETSALACAACLPAVLIIGEVPETSADIDKDTVVRDGEDQERNDALAQVLKGIFGEGCLIFVVRKQQSKLPLPHSYCFSSSCSSTVTDLTQASAGVEVCVTFTPRSAYQPDRHTQILNS